MKPLASKIAAKASMAGAFASAMLFVVPVFAQDSRLSLADRVSLLEQRAQNKDQAAAAQVNQMQQMQSQLRDMQGQIEELQHQLQLLQDKSKDQYVDLDSRLGRLEAGNQQGTAPASASSAPAASAVAPAADSSAATTSAQAAASAAKPLSPGDRAAMEASYDAAFKTLRGGDYVGASRQFRTFIEKYPDQPLASNALYWLGESYYVTTNYKVALEAFQQLLSRFPQSEKAPDALLKVGYCQYELKQVPAAATTLKAVISKYPGSKAASLAKERLGRIQRGG